MPVREGWFFMPERRFMENKLDSFEKVLKVLNQIIRSIEDLEQRVRALESGVMLIKKEELI